MKLPVSVPASSRTALLNYGVALWINTVQLTDKKAQTIGKPFCWLQYFIDLLLDHGSTAKKELFKVRIWRTGKSRERQMCLWGSLSFWIWFNSQNFSRLQHVWSALKCPDVLHHSVVFNSLWPHGPPDSSVHGNLQARILEWVAKSSSRESFQFRDETHVSCGSTAGRF